jgi:transposase
MGFTKRDDRPSNKRLLALKAEGWTQQEIANMFGRGRSTITKWLAQAEAEAEQQYNADTSIPQTRVVSTRK